MLPQRDETVFVSFPVKRKSKKKHEDSHLRLYFTLSVYPLKILPVFSSKNKVNEEPLCIRGLYQEKKKQPTEYPIKD